MPFYQRQGETPRKRHTVFRKKDGSLYYEEHMSRGGFSGLYSNLYHVKMPTRVKRMGVFRPIQLVAGASRLHSPRHIKTFELEQGRDILSSRKLLFFNQDILISKAHPTAHCNFFYRNGHFDELLYVQQGSGEVLTQFGVLDFSMGDYLVIPRGVIYKLKIFNDPKQKNKEAKFLILESVGSLRTPKRYRNAFGQLLEQSPYCERDIRTPRLEAPDESKGEFHLLTRLSHGIQEQIYDSHPFDVVGWDGFHYPWAFNISDFEPIVGRIHQPPPVHQTFEGDGFVICSFVSRPFDFHPDSVPAPYPHSNLDSDEILFYSEGEFMSRKGIFQESMTYHPMGIPHGPQPGRYEESIGKKETKERAVMIDTFRPMQLAQDAEKCEDMDYALSWIDS
jgi:homogentisate 1,2-dioxygenase